jgi:transcriptional regulator with XRE-family HTH domain
MNEGFVERLGKAFGGKSMAKVARMLKVPHATVRNYYLGRLPSPDVLIKIANETGVSLNWLLIGAGTMYAEKRAPVSLDDVLDERIAQLIDQRVREIIAESGSAVPPAEFDVESAVERFNDPERVMSEWLRFEGREYPSDYGVVFFRGWESFSPEDKIAAVRDAKRVLDRSLH